MGLAASNMVRLLFFFFLVFPFFFTAYRWLREVFPRRLIWRCGVLAVPLGFSLMIVAVGLLGRAFGSFYQGVWIGWGIVLLGGGLLQILNYRRKELVVASKIQWQFSDGLTIFFLLTSTLLVSLVAHRYALYDELGIQGHASLTEVMLRGIYPPPFLSFAEIPNRYHFGFNLITAIFAYGLKIPAVQAIDLVTVLLWIALGLLSLELCAYWKLPRVAWPWAFLLLFLTGGLSWLLARNAPGPAQVPHWQEMYLYGRYLHQNFTNYFFQHPMGLGAVLFLATIQFFSDYFEKPKAAKLWIGALLLGAMSLAQVMFFSTLLAALGLVFFLRLFRKGVGVFKNVWAGLLTLVLSLALALFLGGFFQFSEGNYENFPVKLAWPPDYLSFEYWGRGRYEPLTLLRYVVWYLSSFGLLLFFIPWALFRAFKDKRQGLWVLGFFCILSLLISQCLYYPYSGNIRKWFLGFELSGKMLVVITLLPLAFSRRWSRVLVIALILSASVCSIRYLGDLSFKNMKSFRGAEKRLAYTRHYAPQGIMKTLVHQLKNCQDCSGRVWSSEELTPYLAIHTGRFLLEMDRSLRSMPVARRLIQERKNDLRDLATAPSLALLDRLQVEWVVFSCDEFTNLTPEVQSFLTDLQTRSVDFGSQVPGQCLFAIQRKPPL